MSEQTKGLNDKAWEAIFDRYDVLSRIEAEGKFMVSASQIKEYREPRLMAKFDHMVNLPQIFSKHELAILPVSRGDYVISHFKAYQPFEILDKNITRAFLPSSIQSLGIQQIPSEAIAINCALASGMLTDFLGEDLLYSTVSGRMGSGQFDFHIQNTKTKCPTEIFVNNSQIEIDAAFEGSHSLSLLEAKRDLSDDFLIRQLYYPFRVWSSRVTKRVKPVFLVYTNGIFSLYEYEFQTPGSYNSLVLIKHKNYSIEDTAIGLTDLQALAHRIPIQEEPAISFPQANSFERVINICELLNTQDLSRDQVTEEYDFDIRQTNYYTDAARYLGFAEKRYEEGRKPLYYLTHKGKKIMHLNYRQRQLAFCEAILQHRVFNRAFQHYIITGTIPETQSIVNLMKESRLYKVESMSTYIRRASTVSGWLNWMIKLTKNNY